MPDPLNDELLTPAEVAALFRVDVKTVARWDQRYSWTVIRTPGGHRRYRAAEVRNVLRGRKPDGSPRD